MKTKIIMLLLLAGIAKFASFAQMLPDKPEDISPLLNGEKIPEAILTSPDSEKVSLSMLIKRKPTVLIIYRGGWCPYCNTHLGEIQKVEKDILGMGYQILAVSPDSPENLISMTDKHQLKYELYSDGNGMLIKSMGLAFKTPVTSTSMLHKKPNDMDERFLPVPSLFVLDNSGTIEFEYINPDFKTRISSDLLLAVLKVLKTSK